MSGALGIVGGGAWGTALAQVLASGTVPVTLWAFEAAVVDAINDTHTNPSFLAGVALHPAITATSDFELVASCAAILMVAPAQHVAALMASIPDRGQSLILCSKGMEQQTARLMADVVSDTQWSGSVAVLSGPTFAHEVATGKPTAVTLAARDHATAQAIAQLIARPSFRPYVSTDVIGAEIGGVVKNVLAIACGIVEGAGLGQNARAALIARGFAEMVRYGLARGAELETLTGLAGLGDLVLTCSSPSSRNYALWLALGQGRSAADLVSDRRTVAEGVFSAAILSTDATQRGTDMPICAAVARLVKGDADAGMIIGELLGRPLTTEGWARRG